jgi:hypothetical protein
MLRHILLGAAIIVSVEAAPVAASAQMCGGILSWLCSNSGSASKSAPEDPRQEQMNPTVRPSRAANAARSREVRETAGVVSAVDSASVCLSQEQVRGGYPRYRVIGGHRCWYASARGRQRKQIEIGVNPHNDPIWKESGVTGPELAANQLQDCEEQALKLFSEEKPTFMKECMSRNAR